MELIEPIKEASDLIRDAGGETFSLCFQCGLCTVSCPWNHVRLFLPHKMICESKFGLVDLEDEAWWLCTTCNTCVSRCPRGVCISDILQSVRSIVLEYQYSMVQPSLRSAMGSLSAEGNPWAGRRDQRRQWVHDLEIEGFEKGHEYLYFPCCALAYDPELGGIARATARILMGFGTRFGTLGVKESCCGESVRKAGNINLFDTLAKSNTEAFLQSGVEKIIVSSPHCYTIFNDEYHRFGADLQVIHLTQYLARLLKEEKITYRKELSKTVVYHDPCYLGRHSGIYEEPRNVLNSIPGLQLLDEIDSRENSLCCGGGGGRIWMETKKGERFSDILVAQAIDQGADILATACPYCIVNFKDSVRTSGKEDILEIKDISEIVDAVI